MWINNKILSFTFQKNMLSFKFVEELKLSNAKQPIVMVSLSSSHSGSVLLNLRSVLPNLVKIFKRPKNREDGSDFDDFRTKSIAPTRPIF